MNGLQLNALRAATQLIERARLNNGEQTTEFLTSAVKLVEEVIAFDEVLERESNGCDCCRDIRAAEAIHGDGPNA